MVGTRKNMGALPCTEVAADHRVALALLSEAGTVAAAVAVALAAVTAAANSG